MNKNVTIVIMLVSVLCRPSVIQRQQTQRQTRKRVIAHSDIVESSRILGQGITAGVIFYTSLQWAHYRRLRMEAEKRTKKDVKKPEDKHIDK
ncbi:hypothetical protein BST79_gp027 [Only Syngen Nebraska virus 5]|uniref:hypothetical protein n=1 Tax=Only Syngen Nebraska virus 5 TaxID=1917232 RepID=UPI0009011C82|nr:hypothetical protein BST79_gp027 [Only Syngen Nebraska virus 5]APC25540.1 hypothetical protein [Only Syngen Nebraska virus 5]